MRTIRSLLWTLGLILVAHRSVVLGQNGTASNTASDGSGQDVSRTPMEEGLRPFYKMTTIFLGIVQRKNLLDNPEKYQEFIQILNSTMNRDPDSGNSDFEDLFANWQFFVKHYLGFVICIAVGILFIIIMPIVGCCFFCCRCCGKCGGRSSPKEGRYAKPVRITCGTLLFLLTMVMLTGMIFAFLSNEQLRVQTSSEDDGAIAQLSKQLDSVDMYFAQSTKEARKLVDSDARDIINRIIVSLTNLPQQALQKLNGLTNSETSLETALSLARSLKKIKTHLQNIVRIKDEIIGMVNTLKNKMQNLQNSVSNSLAGCTTTKCNELRNQLTGLDSSLDFSKSAQDLTNELNKVNAIVPANLMSLIEQNHKKYLEIATKVNNTIDAEIENVRREAEQILDQIRLEVDAIEKNFAPVRTSLRMQEPLETAKSYLERYGNYRWYGGIALCCVFLLVVLCFFMGLAFGAWGERPYEDARICNKGVGANLLLAGVGFCFLFSWLLMLVCTILFIPGGLTYTEVCRHISPIPVTGKYTDPRQYLTLDTEYSKRLVDVLTANLIRDAPLNNVSTILRNCQKNQGIYKAFGLERVVPLDIVFNIDNYNVRSKLDQLKDLTISLTDVEIISAQTESQLRELANADLDSIDFTVFYTELDKTTTVGDLSNIESEMRALATDLRALNENAKADELDGHADTLRDIRTTDIGNINLKLADLRTAVDGLRNEVDQRGAVPSLQQRTLQLIDDLKAAQTKIRQDGERELKLLFVETANNLFTRAQGNLNNLKSKVENNLAKCGPLYRSVSGAVNIACVGVLNPFNGFWFSFGWCIAFIIPCIIMAVKLAGLYRKTDKYDSIDNKSFDDPADFPWSTHL